MIPEGIPEGDARELLARAAATIDVDDALPLTLTGLPEPPRRRWPAVVAVAAAVAVVAGLGYGAAQLTGDEATGPGPAASREPVEQGIVLDDNQVPGLIGYTEEEATELLESRGLAVEVRGEPDGCNVPGIVTGSAPAVGTRVNAGDTVTIRVVKRQQVIDCVGEIDWSGIWELVRFARGLSGPPALADRLTLQTSDDGPPSEADPSVVLTRAEAADPRNWVICADDGGCHSALGALLDLVTRAWEHDGDEAPSPRPVARWSFDGAPCLDEHLDRQERDDWDHRFWVEVPSDGPWCPPTSVFIDYDNDDGSIAAVGLDTAPDEGGAELTEPELAENLDRVASAQEFITWARGNGPAPDFAATVRRLFGDREGTNLPRAQAEEYDSWSLPCPRWMSAPCSPDLGNPLAVIRRDGRHPVTTVPADGRSDFCSQEPAGLPADLAAAVAADMVEIAQARARGCRGAYRVELWVDHNGAIYAVNLIGHHREQATSPRH